MTHPAQQNTCDTTRPEEGKCGQRSDLVEMWRKLTSFLEGRKGCGFCGKIAKKTDDVKLVFGLFRHFPTCSSNVAAFLVANA